jgi:cobalt-zinc-cadmium efflux system protein
MAEAHLHSTAHVRLRRLTQVLALTVVYMLAEVAGGLITGSLALLADAGHVFVDAAGMAIGLTAVTLGARNATREKTYGYYRLEIVAVLLNGLALFAIAGYILFESVRRFADPPDLPGLTVVAFAVPGLAVNVIAGWLLFEGQKVSLNFQGAFVEVLSDLAGSIAVIVSGTVIFATGFRLIDPIVSLLIGLFILPRTFKLLNEALHVLLEGVPRNVNIDHVREHILGAEGVTGVHDLHVWNLTSGMNVMSAHVVVGENVASGQVLSVLRSCLAEHFDIEHSTFQIEQADSQDVEHASHL